MTSSESKAETAFQKNRFEQIEDALRIGDVRAVRQLAMAVRAEYVPVHDGFRDTVALTLGYLAKTYGAQMGESVGQTCVEKLMAGGDPPQYSQNSLKDRMKSIAFGWHWHVTRLTVTEDDEKVSFTLHPCGSGMRIIQEGYYEAGPFGPSWAGSSNAPLTRAEVGTKSNFMSEGFPIYCNHCAEMGYMALRNGSATFLVEGWTPHRAKGICAQHTFKDIQFVPEEFYRRADLPFPQQTKKPTLGERLFTPDELIELQTHPLDKLVDRAEAKDHGGASEALAECLSGWRDAIHDVYRNWASRLWLEVQIRLGDEAFSQTVRAISPDLFRHIRGANAAEWEAFWSIHLRLREVRETADAIEFVVDQDSILQPDVLPESAAWFAQRLNEGLADRGWSEIGQFAAVGHDLVHRLPKQ
ncbi:MAG: hypothetical protein KF726_00380 [Anaerolineae bacterium]|nr:hypothetical protein [Anaerolineae bacterium]